MAYVNNLQAIIVRPTEKAIFATLLFGISDPGCAKQFLRVWLPRTPVGSSPGVEGEAELHFLFSWTGMRKLLKDHPDLDVEEGERAFEVFFVDPAQTPARLAPQLGLIGKSDPANWWRGFTTGEVELAVYGAFADEGQKDEYVGRLRTSALTGGLTELQVPSFVDGVISGYRPPGGRLHFGYRDGITTPDIDWSDSGRPGSINLREIIVGYPSSDYPTAPFKPGPWRDFSHEGSYACLTWISQDVAGFEDYLTRTAPAVAMQAGGADPKEWLAARLLGRWRNGTPLPLHNADQPEPPDLNNSFGYATDPTGLKCPLTAHIRIVNSRDQPLKFANQVRFPNGPPRLVRRGFSYGRPWSGSAVDTEDRGMVGLFLCARVNEQFYTILRWMHRTDFSDVFKGINNGLDAQDALVGDRSDPTSNSTLHLPATQGHAIDLRLETFLGYRGIAILFVPGIRALATLAAD